MDSVKEIWRGKFLDLQAENEKLRNQVKRERAKNKEIRNAFLKFKLNNLC